jgi:hypothetical protein
LLHPVALGANVGPNDATVLIPVKAAGVGCGQSP